MRARVSVLVVCSGNICRSPTAEGVFRDLARRRGFADRFRVASRGMHDYHAGEPPDPRTVEHARSRGYDLSAQRASVLQRGDFQEFDYILAMDHGHLRQLRAVAPRDSPAKLSLFLEASGKWPDGEVPDPYYGGAAAFEEVLDMVEEAAERWLDRIEAELDPGSVRPGR